MKTRAPTARPTDFYQLDVEMSFVEQEDVFAAVQPVIQGLFEHFGQGRKVHADWPRIAYRDSLLWYGSDKPDLRNPIRMQVCRDHFRDSGFAIFANLLEERRHRDPRHPRAQRRQPQVLPTG